MPAEIKAADQRVSHFRQILMWPLQLMPLPADAPIDSHSQLLEAASMPTIRGMNSSTSSPATPVNSTSATTASSSPFLPYVQRFLYGEGGGQKAIARYGESPIRIFRRHDVAKVRMTFKEGDEALNFEIVHLDLYFFYDIDVVILVVEICADDLELRQVQDTLYRFGRAYPPYWDDDGSGGHCLKRARVAGGGRSVLSASDYEKRSKYLSFVSRFRAPCISSHWEFLLRPLVLHHSDARKAWSATGRSSITACRCWPTWRWTIRAP
jgi:hypothetical protein